MYYFIINPHSRSGHGLDLWKKTEEFLTRQEVEYKAYFTEYTGHASEFARQIANLRLPCTLSVLGGDGTLNEVINGLAQSDFSHITLGCIPTGSGNDFARGLGISKEIPTCIQSILSPSVIKPVDIGFSKTRENSRYFLVSSGIGYDADICRKVAASPLKKLMNKIKLGKLTYVLIALKLLMQYSPCPVSVRLDKKEIFHVSRFFFIAAMNLKYEGGGVKFCPEAEFDDSKLDICLVGKLSKLKILALFPTAFQGKHTRFKGIQMMKCRQLDIRSKKTLPIHCDGESLGISDRLTIMNTGKQIKVIVE